MVEGPLENVNAQSIERLIANGVAEGRSIEYKEALPGTTSDEKKEFLADVSSFANAAGGDIVYGVVERRDEAGKPTGIPDRADGVSATNRDAETLRIENILRDGIAPRIPGIRYRWVDGFSTGPVLVLRVPRSWTGPHMVTFQHYSRFYARNASGKYLLDVGELRDAFLRVGSLSERARGFILERLGRIGAGDLPFPLDGRHYVCVHVIPHSPFAGAVSVDLLKAANANPPVRPFHAMGGWGSRFNIDGLLVESSAGDGANLGYLQLFRNGIIESVDSVMLRPYEGRVTMPSRAFAQEMFEFSISGTGVHVETE